MGFFEIIAVLLTLTAVFSFLNHRLLRLPQGIGVMLVGVVVSVTLTIMDHMGLPVKAAAQGIMNNIDFRDIVLEGLLGFLLFAAALQVNLDDLLQNKLRIGAFALVTTLLSTLIVGVLFYSVAHALGYSIRFIECLMFGAIISPTDTVATISIVRKAGAPKALDLDITGESLFNDAVGIMLFLILLRMLQGEGTDTTAVAGLFGVAVIAGIAIGLVLGYIAYLMIKATDHPRIQVLITLALAAGGYVLAIDVDASGPLAVVIAGLIVGQYARRLATSENARSYLNTFWEVMDEILNALLFVLIGLQVLVLEQTVTEHLGAVLLSGLLAIPIVLVARLISLGVPIAFLRRWRTFAPNTLTVMTWGGLRGGLCIALALSLPDQTPQQYDAANLIVGMTYVVVAFSILVQGLTLEKLVARSMAVKGGTQRPA